MNNDDPKHPFTLNQFIDFNNFLSNRSIPDVLIEEPLIKIMIPIEKGHNLSPLKIKKYKITP